MYARSSLLFRVPPCVSTERRKRRKRYRSPRPSPLHRPGPLPRLDFIHGTRKRSVRTTLFFAETVYLLLLLLLLYCANRTVVTCHANARFKNQKTESSGRFDCQTIFRESARGVRTIDVGTPSWRC